MRYLPHPAKKWFHLITGIKIDGVWEPLSRSRFDENFGNSTEENRRPASCLALSCKGVGLFEQNIPWKALVCDHHSEYKLQSVVSINDVQYHWLTDENQRLAILTPRM